MNVKIHGLLKILIFSLAGVAYAAEGLPQLNHGHFLEKRRHLAKKKQQSPPSKAKHKGQQKKKSVKNVRPEKKTAMAKRRGKGQRIKALKAKSKEMQRLRSGAEEGHQIQLPNSAPVQSKRQKIPTGVLQSSAKNLQINSEFQNPIVSSAENEKPIESKNLQPMIPMKESKSLVAPVAFRMEDLGNENIFEGQSTYEESYKKLREKLGLTKDSLALGERRINAWKDGFKHKNFSSNPLRATIQTFFSYEENYKDLMQRAHEIIGPEAEKIPGFHFWSVAEIQKASGEIDGGGKFPDFQVILGLGVESLQHFDPDSENVFKIVQVASQFNGLESTSITISPLNAWVGDRTQGPGACLQALLASALRCAAQEKGKLPDALEPLLEKCRFKDGQGNDVPICEKYPQLYVNGYLQLPEIKDIKDLESFAQQVENNIGELRILCQNVKCEESEKTQLQVFCAAPAFQGYGKIDWNSNDNKTNAYKRICKALLAAEYKALAQLAARSSKCQLHLTLVGMGSFNNPPETINEALRETIEQLKGSEVQVYLHGYAKPDIGKWNAALKSNGYSEVDIDKFNRDQLILTSTKKQ